MFSFRRTQPDNKIEKEHEEAAKALSSSAKVQNMPIVSVYSGHSYFKYDEELLELIHSFIWTKRDDSKELLKLCGVSRTFAKVFQQDKFWKSSYAILSSNSLESGGDMANNNHKEAFMTLKRKQLGIEYTLSQFFGSYVSVACHNQKFRTEIVNKTQSPSFEKEFILSLNGITPDDFFKESLVITLVDKHGDAPIGTIDLKIRDFEYDLEETFTEEPSLHRPGQNSGCIVEFTTKIYHTNPDHVPKKRRNGIVDGIKFLDRVESLVLRVYIKAAKNLPERKDPKKGMGKKTILLEDPQDYYILPLEKLNYEEEPFDSIVWGEEDGKKTVECATLGGLIQALTSPDWYDNSYIHTFMLTFRNFTDRNILLEKLIERFNIPPPPQCTSEEFAKFKSEKLDKIRLRVVSAIRYWIENFYLFDFDVEFKKKIDDFVLQMDKVKSGKILSVIITKALKKAAEDENIVKNVVVYPPIEHPKFALFGHKYKNKILNWPSVEIARQITLIEFEIFRSIEPKECLNLSWSKGQRETKAPGITAMIAKFNALSNWIGTSIVEFKEIKDRAEVIDKFVDIGDQLYELNNFNGIFSVVSGLSLAPIYRLKKTWSVTKSKETFDKLNALMSREGNFKAIRERIKNVKPPLLPYIGRYLTDLTFVEDGNPKLINGKINFVKCKCFAGVIRDMQLYQNQGYDFKECKELKDLLLNLNKMTDEEMYQASIVVEPKEVKKK